MKSGGKRKNGGSDMVKLDNFYLNYSVNSDTLTLFLTKTEKEWEDVFDKGFIKLTEKEVEAFKDTLKKLSDDNYRENLKKELINELKNMDKKKAEQREEFRRIHGF